MLEESTLRLLPWRWTTPASLMGLAAPAWARRAEAAETHAALGFIRLAPRPAWLGLGPRRLEAYETDDASLIFTIERGWFLLRPWRVFDAEESRIGAVLGPHLLDDRDFRFASVWTEDGAARVIRSTAGAVLARIESRPDGETHLRFNDHRESNPFLRMLLLAAAVLAVPLPC